MPHFLENRQIQRNQVTVQATDPLSAYFFLLKGALCP